MSTFTLTARGPFALASSATFLEGFTPASFAPAADRALELAFPVEGDWQSVGVRVREHPHGVTGEILSPSPPGRKLSEAVRAQVARILSLDVDGSGFPAVGARDHIVAGLQNRYPGLRPVCFYSPYEAAAWAIIGHRIRIRQAATIKARMAEQLGDPISFTNQDSPARPPSPTTCLTRRPMRNSSSSARTGSRTAPGSASCYAHNWRTKLARSAADLCQPDSAGFEVRVVLSLPSGTRSYI
jgi:DNA-3-methyladenine glycosylase II